jgi:NAD(P)-dependent dehydrogenase (short-subunit alcohol dehydrogenase family)
MSNKKQALMKSLGSIPVGRQGHPEEVAELVVFLVSDRVLSTNGSEYVIPSQINYIQICATPPSTNSSIPVT